ncbi:hemolysin family protein [Ignavibacterium sp.]|uniref:hemolysin family protein n=1 Tax=Ignavibacterium sp. TaxID=2651167 RepID=UPI00307E75D3
MILEILFLILVFINFLLSISEIALGAFGENKIEELRESKDDSVPYFEKLNSNQEEVYGTIQFIYHFLLITISILGYIISSGYIFSFISKAEQLANIADIISILLTALILTFVVLVFNVLIPKAIAFKYSDYIGKKSVRKILFLSDLFKYTIRIISSAANFILLPLKEKIGFSQSKPFEDEILDIISDGVKSGTLDETEQKIIENVFEFTDLKANEVMIPRTEMIAINIEDDIGLNIKKIIQTGHTLIPVYENSIDNIIGVLHTKDVMKFLIEKKDISLKELMRPVYYVPESKPISQILRDMQKQGQRLAIVTDEYGGTEGMITMEDILEEIIGEIRNEGREYKTYSKGKDGKYYILGSMNTSDFNEVFNYKLPESDEYNTIAGFVSERTGKILNPGEELDYEGLVFELIKKIRQKMVQFRVYAKNGVLKENETETS